MEDVFWEGMEGQGGWEQRSKDTPQDIFLCIGIVEYVIILYYFLTCQRY